MTDIRKAAQALVDASDRYHWGGRPSTYRDALRQAVDALRVALSAPPEGSAAPSPSRDAARGHCRCLAQEQRDPDCEWHGVEATIRDAALEEAAEVISHILDTNPHGSGRAALAVARVRIRALKGQPATAHKDKGP